jgi:hypothetical protein
LLFTPFYDKIKAVRGGNQDFLAHNINLKQTLFILEGDSVRKIYDKKYNNG